MTDENPNPEGENEETPDQETPEGEETDEEEESETVSPEDFKKLKQKAERRDRALRKAQEELAKLKAEAEKKENGEEDPVEKANRRLLNASARTALASAGIPKEEHAEALKLLNLTGIDVDEDGPDEEEIEERIEALRRIFGSAKATPPGTKRPRTVRAPDRSKGETTDADSARYRRIIGAR